MKLKTLRKYWSDGFTTVEAYAIHQELAKAIKLNILQSQSLERLKLMNGQQTLPNKYIGEKINEN